MNGNVNTVKKIADHDLFLASTSPRRKELMEQLQLTFQVVNAPIEEVALPHESVRSFVLRMAIEKALSGFNKVAGKQIWVVGSDTAVVYDDKVFGKPRNQADAYRMLTALSGSTHQVYTSVAVVHDGEVFSALNETHVTFAELDENTLQAYLQTGEYDGKAGGYGIQGMAAAFIEKIDGSYSGVMGLPLYELQQLLSQANYPIWE